MAYKEAKAERGGGGSRKKKLDHTEIRNSENGGHTVEHHFDNSLDYKSFRRPVTYSFSNGPEMVKHVMDAHGVKEAEMVAHLKGDNEAEPGGGEAEEEGAGEEQS
ncbi:MAG TPA: hypothetical protein VKY85_07665 [Candidatus Angelobacter sp.]|nr:hypothetical protein [Candidatus Angelobacter sp.]